MTGGNGGFDKAEAAEFLDQLAREHKEGVQDISAWDTGAVTDMYASACALSASPPFNDDDESEL